MYILQIYDTFTQELLHQEKEQNPDVFKDLIESAMDWQKVFIYDDNKRTLIGEYVCHTISQEGENTVFKVYFIVHLLTEKREVFV